VGRAGAGRRGHVRELDPGRAAARARLPAPARRRRPAIGAAGGLAMRPTAQKSAGCSARSSSRCRASRSADMRSS
jgi:hypothetical protein